MGYTGRLVFDRDDTPIAMPRNDLVFEVNSGYDFSNGFIVTTPDGIKYSFEAIERTTITGSGEGTYSVPTAWYLTQIRHPLGDVIKLTYEMDNYNYPISASSIVTKPTNLEVNPDGCPYADCPPASENTALLIQVVVGKRLTSIESMHNGSIIFNASTDRSDIAGASNLCSIDIKDTRGSILKSFALDYAFSNNTAFKNQLALADEHVIHRMFLTKVREKDKFGNEVRHYSMEYDDINALPARLSYARDHWGYFNGANNSGPFPETFTAYDYWGQPIFTGPYANREPDGTHAKKGLLGKKITYPTGGSSDFFYEGNTYYGLTENIETGGVRIASITNHDPVTGNNEITNYQYARHNQLSQSSGKKMGLDPTYTTTYSFERGCINPAPKPGELPCTTHFYVLMLPYIPVE